MVNLNYHPIYFSESGQELTSDDYFDLAQQEMYLLQKRMNRKQSDKLISEVSEIFHAAFEKQKLELTKEKI